MSGRAATINVVPGNYALSVGRADMSAPKGWQWVSLGEVARLESGHTPSREHPEYWNGGIPWVGIKDARTHHGGMISRTFQTVTQAGIDNSAARLLPAHTVCLSRTASVGYVVVLGREMATSQDFVNWVCGPAIEPHFLKQLLIAENESLFRFGKGSTHTTIYYPEVKAFHVCLPSVDEQRRVVAKLEALQARSRRAREALDAVPPLLEKLRQSILAAAFRGDLTKDWRAKHKDVEPASELLKRIRIERRKKWEEAEFAKMKAKGKTPTDDQWKTKYEEPEPVDATGLPELPEGWCWASVEELTSHIVDCLHRTPTYVADGVPAIRTADVIPGRLLLDQARRVSRETYVEQVSRLVPEPGDVFYSREGERFGLAALVPDGCEVCISQRMMHFRAVAQISPVFFMWALNSPLVYAQARRDVGGSTSPHVNIRSIRLFYIALAPQAEQAAIAARIEGAWGRLEALKQVCDSTGRSLSHFDAGALARAFRGELVPQDPNDEPAEAMLARLRQENGPPSSREKLIDARPARSRVRKAV